MFVYLAPRESPPIYMLEELKGIGANVSYHDPYVAQIRVGDGTMDSEDLDAALASAELVVVATDHSCFDMSDIVSKSKHVLDTRGLTRKLGEHFDNVTLL